MVSTTPNDFVRSARPEIVPFSLIEQPGLFRRLGDEVSRTARELRRDPRGFVRAVLTADSRDTRRRRLIYIGLACAVVAHAAMLVLIVVLGWHRMFQPIDEARGDRVIMLPPSSLAPSKTDGLEPEKPLGAKEGRGGGGGQEAPQPASHGVLPQMLPQPQLVNMNPSNIPEPTLPVAPTIVGPESPPPPPGSIGDPKGKSDTFSGGPGTGGGIGGGDGTGVGGGDGPGAGPGGGGGSGNNKRGGSPDGGLKTPDVLDFNKFSAQPNRTAFSWLRRPTPVVTPEAQQNKVIGIVLLRATFNADGTITDIEVVSPVEEMTESAIDSLRRSKFRPATVNGIPVTVRRVPIKIFVHY